MALVRLPWGARPVSFRSSSSICQLLGTITVKSSKLFQKANASIFYAALSLPTTKLYFVFQRHRAGHSRCNQHAGRHVRLRERYEFFDALYRKAAMQ
jgi:hypothetical protein